MKRVPLRLWLVLAVVFFAGILKATLPPITIGNWTATTSLAQPRSGAATALMNDGRILFTGGDSGGTAEFFNADGSVSSAGSMTAARSQHFAVVMSDGRVLVGGGNSGGGTTNSAEIYDPSAGAWTATGTMTSPRANATAALLQDGRVVIAGGDNAGAPNNTIEVFDPSSGSFSVAGTMSASRTKQAMAVLQSGQVLIIGGFDGTNPLASTDVFDPSAGTIAAGPALANARYSATATKLLNGQVAVIGGAGSDGNGGTTDLASIEIFDPTAGAFSTASAALTTAREGHQAFLLPNNNNVLITGGTSGGNALASAELFSATASPTDGSWSYAVSATGAMTTARTAASGAANQQNGPTSKVTPMPGLVIVGGGTDASNTTLASTEAYGYPTVQTDQGDYPPGTNVHIQGSGFQANEQVTITLVESPLFDTHGPYTIAADGNGNISDSSFTTDIHDENVRFWLSATGQSGRVAQNTFTDAGPAGNGGGSMSVLPTTVTAGSTGNNFTFTFQGVNGKSFGTGSQVTVALPSGWSNFQTTNSTGAGFVSNFQNVSGGTSCLPPTPTVSVTSTLITVTQTCSANDKFSFKYSDVTVPTSAGTATFTTMSSDTSVSGGASLTAIATQPAVTVTAAAANSITATAGTPQSAQAGTAFTTNLGATVKDAFGNPVPSVTVTFTAPTTGASGKFANNSNTTTATTNSSGVATASTFTANTTAGGYNVTASVNGVSPNATFSLTNTAGSAAKFSVNAPANATAGTAFSVTVTAQDSNGNTVTNYSGTVKFSSTDAQAVLPANSTLTNGTGTFNFTLKSAGNQTVTATDTVTATITGTSGTITVEGGQAAKLAFGQQPTNALAGSTITPAVTVFIQDQFGNATTSNANVTLAIGSNPSGGTLSGTTTVAASGGTATFSNLSINNAGSGYTLSASSSGLTGATSSSFNIDSLIAFTSAVATEVAGNCSPQLTLQRQNQGGTAASLASSETVALSANVANTAFFSDAACQNALSGNNLTVAAGQSSASFFFKNTSTTLPPFNITITGTKSTFVSTTASQTESVIPNISFANAPGASTVGLCSPTAAKIVAADGSDTVIAPAAPITVNLTTSSANGAYFTDNACTNAITSIQIPAGNKGGAMPFYKDNSAGTPTLTATAGAAQATTQTAVNKATAVFSNLSAPTIASGSTPTTFSGTVNKSGSVLATGTVTITLAGTTGPISQSATLDSNGNFSASIATDTVAPGTYVIQYAYPGDANFNPPSPNPNVSNSLKIIAPPSISKAFGAASIPLNGTTSLTFTITNPAANAVALSGLAFTDSFPPGLVVATPNGLVDNCGGTATAAAGSGSVSLSGGSVNASSSCTIIVNVTGTTTGLKNNTTGNVSSTNGGTGNTASASITVVAPPAIAKAFGAATIPLNGTTSLTFTITNPAANTVALNGLAFSDSLPAGLVIANTPNLTNNCGGTSSATGGGSSVSLSGGSVAANASCTVSVNVTGTTAGQKNNTTGNVSSTNGGTGNTASASITVDAPPTISKAFGAAQINLNTSTSLTFTISNSNSNSLTGVAFTDVLPAGLVIATPNGLSGVCLGTVTAVAGSGSINLSGGTIAGSGLCTISVNVTGTSTGMKPNTTGPVTSTEGGTGATSNTATLNVVGTPPTIKSANSVTFTAGIANSFTVTTDGTPTPSLSETGTLPSAISFTDNGHGTATIAYNGTAITAGSYPIVIKATNGVPPDASQNFAVTVVAGAPASVIAFSGSGQSATVGMGFANPLVAKVQDTFNNPVSGATVMFAAPASGPSGSFIGSSTATTDANGLASASFAANTGAGLYAVTASVSGVTTPASFLLTNNPGPITTLALNRPSASITAGDTQAYTAVGFDSYGNMVTDVTASTVFTITAPGACTSANCGSQVAGSYTVTGTYNGVAQGMATLTVAPGTFAQLQLLVPGETAAPGTATGKTGIPNTEYVNGQFSVTANATDQFFNVVGSVTDTVHITSTDNAAKLPAGAALVNGTGSFSVTLETPSNPASTTITATDTADGTKTDTSPKIQVIVVYTATIAPTLAGTGDATAYTLTVNNAAAPNTNNLESVQVSVPSPDQGSISGVTVSASNGGPALNWNYDNTKLPSTLRFLANSDADAVTPGGTITITFTATSNANVTTAPVPEEWTTIAFSDKDSSNSLPLAGPEPTVQIGKAAEITSANTTTFTYQTPGTTFTVTTTGVPTPTVSESGSLAPGLTFTANNDGTATISGTPTAAGSYPITITAHSGFGPDATQTLTIVVNKADSVSTIISSSQTSVFGQPVTFTATVSAVGPATGTPTGSVTFYADGTTQIGTAQTLNNYGKASVSTSTLTVASHSITAVYSGDTNFNKTNADAGSQAIAFTQDVNKADTSSTVVSGVNPSVFGQSVTFTATVAVLAPGSGTPTGTVQFMDGANPLGSPVVLSAGQASSTASALSVAKHYITALYSGDGSFNATGKGSSTATQLCQIVNKADSKSVVTGLSPSVYGQSVTFTATVTAVAPGAGIPSGTVQFMDGASPIGSSVPLGNGQASFTTSNLSAGTHYITVVYTGDGNFNGSTSTAFTQIVNKVNATITVTPYSTTYDAMPHTATGTATGVFGEALSGLDLSGTTHTSAGTYYDTWTFTDSTGNYNNTSGKVTDVIAKANAVIVVTPYDYVYDGDQHTATGSATGVVGEALAGLDLSKTVHTQAGTYNDTWYFVDQTGNYNNASAMVTDVIEQATPTVTWNNPADIAYGTPLSGTQLDATFTFMINGSTTVVPGVAVYTPAAGTVLTVGTHTLSLSFTPTDVVDFKSVTDSVQINVTKATPQIFWQNPADITYGTALGNTQLDALALPPTSAVTGWFKGEGDASDSSPTGNNGTAGPGMTFVPGEVGQAFSFDGSSDSGVTIPYNVGYDLNAPGFAATFWVKGSQNANGTETLLDKSHGVTDNTGWAFEVNSSSGILQFEIGQGGTSPCCNQFTTVSSTVNILDGNLHYIVGSWDATAATMSLYVDGVLQATAPVASAPANNTRGLNIGYSWGGGTATNFFAGVMDEVQIYDVPAPAGTYVYNPASGTQLNTGKNQPLSVTFTPADSADLNTANDSVNINVNAAPLTITANNQTKIYGSAFTFAGTEFSTNGLVNGDTVSSVTLNSAGAAATAAVSGSPYDIVPSAAGFGKGTGSNYNIMYVNGKFTVTPANTATAVSSPQNPSTFGQAVTFTATVTNTSGTAAVPTGSVQFLIDGVAFGSPVALNASGVATSGSTSTLTVNGSPHTVKATYANTDGNFNGSYGELAGGQTVNPATTAAAVTSSQNPSTFGKAVTFTATVTNTSGTGVVPTGAVQFVVDGVNFGSPVPLDASGSASSGAISTLTVNGSPHSVKANYVNADGNFKSGYGLLAGGQVVNPANTSTGVSSSQNPSTFGQAVTFTATVTNGSGTGVTPTGAIQFAVDGNSLGSPVAVSATGTATSMATATIPVSGSPHAVTAAFVNGDGNFNNSGGSLTPGQTVNPAPTMTTVSSSSNPSVYGQAVMFTATVNNVTQGGASTATPTGSVQFVVDGGAFGPAVPLTGGTATSPATSTLTVPGPPHSVSAYYTNTDGNFSKSNGILSGGQNVTPASLTIGATSGVMTYGTAPVVVMPTYSGFVNGDGPGTLSSPPNSPPVCTPVFSSSTPAGTYTTSCPGAVDPNYTITLAYGSVTVSQAASSTTIVSSSPNNTSTFMQLVTLTATVVDNSNGSTGTPTGTVTFQNTVNGNTTTLGTGTLSVVGGQNIAVFSTTGLPATTAGMYDNITAVYGGDNNFTGGTSPTLQQTVQPAPIVTINPTSLSFGNTNIGSTSSGSTITISNLGDANLMLGSGAFTFTGPNMGDFPIQSNSCGSTLGYPGSGTANTCTITFAFKPAQPGVEVATFQITDNDDDTSGAQQYVSLTGSGLSTIPGTSLYTDAVFATSTNCGAFTLSGGSVVDSFNSSLGFAASHVNSGGNVGSNGNVTLNGSNTKINGTVATDADSFGACSKGSVTGVTANGAPAPQQIALGGQVAFPTPPAANPVPPTAPQNVTSCPTGMAGCTNMGNKVVAIAPGTYGNVSISGGTTAHFSKGTYNFNSLTLSGKSILHVDSGPVVVNIAGASLSGGAPAMDVSGGSIENPTYIPANLQFTYAGSHGVNLSGGSLSYAVVYAPNALVNMSGGTDFFGSIIGGTVTGSGGTAVHYDSNLPNIQAGNFIWFTAVVNNVGGLPASQQVKLYLTNSTISFTANGVPYNYIPVPNAVVTFNSASLKNGVVASSGYDLANNRWSTNIAKSGLTGNTFVSGVAFQVPANFPTGIQNVTWSASFSTDTPGVTLQWQWAAGVYSQFSSISNPYANSGNANLLNVNPEDGSADPYGTDPAGTPEAFKSSATFGATGGYFSAASGVVPTVAQASVSPSSLSFGNQVVGTTSQAQIASLTNNYTNAFTISNISVAGTNAADFIESDTCPRGAGAFVPGMPCTITVTFTPTTSNFESAKIVVSDNANNAPQTLYVNGTGTAGP